MTYAWERVWSQIFKKVEQKIQTLPLWFGKIAIKNNLLVLQNFTEYIPLTWFSEGVLRVSEGIQLKTYYLKCNKIHAIMPLKLRQACDKHDKISVFFGMQLPHL